VADREGRFCWRPRTLKPDILPSDDENNFGDILKIDELVGNEIMEITP